MILELILTILKSNVIFRGTLGSSLNCLEPKIEPQKANLACTNA